MTIWHHYPSDRLHRGFFLPKEVCPFCRFPLKFLGQLPDRDSTFAVDFGIDAHACPSCGWWKLTRLVHAAFGPGDPYTPNSYSHRTYAATASLCELNVADIDVPIAEVRSYLAAQASERFSVHPRVMEQVVGAVFADFGYRVRVTSYSGDRGIDAILDGSQGETIGVQVRRYRNAIDVEQIRGLLGALILGGHTKGVFVTTADFRRGCYQAANMSAAIGIPMTLVNGTQFIDALRLANSTSFRDYCLDSEFFASTTLGLLSFNQGGCSDEREYIWTLDSIDQ